MVPVAEIADPKNDYNLNLPRYIDSTEPEDLQDIDAHLRGGIPERDLDALGHYWRIMPGLRAALFGPSTRPSYAALKLPIAEVKPAIFGHAEFTAFTTKARKLFTQWQTASVPLLKGFAQNGHPKPLIETIAEDLLATFKTAPLLDAYDVYQHLMDYWAETMQDDCYLIADAGWIAGALPREIIQVQNKEKKLVWPEPHDYKVGSRRFKSDLVPAALLIARHFATERDAIAALEAGLAGIEQQLEELTEEHSGDDGILRDVTSKAEAEAARTESIVTLWQDVDSSTCAEYTTLKATAADLENSLKALSGNHHFSPARNAKGKLTLKAIKDRLKILPAGIEQQTLDEYVTTEKSAKETKKKAELLFTAIEPQILSRLSENPLPEELRDLDVVVRYLSNLDQQAETKARLKTAQDDLEAKLDAKYPTLTEADIQTLVVDDKWLATLAAAVQGELDRVSQTLTGRIRQLAERYATPLPQLTDEVATLAARVEGHLRKMGHATVN
jgi:type I restriction enzyme M protein